MTVLVVGDVLTDTVVRLHSPLAVGTDAPASITDTPGGQGANVARWLVRAGVPSVRLLSAVSASDPVDHALHLRKAGIDAALVSVDAPVARIVVVVDAAGTDRSFLTQRGAAALLDAEAADHVDMHGVSWCHVSGYLLSSTPGRACYARLRERCNELSIPISVDPASVAEIAAIGTAAFRSLLSGVHLLLPNEHEARALSTYPETATAANDLLELADTVVVTCSADGAVAASRSTGPLRVPATPAPQVDPTGAGDAFAAGLIASLGNGEALLTALSAGSRLAATAVATLGAAPPGPGIGRDPLTGSVHFSV